MPLISSTNRNSIILQDIINWLSQIKISGQPNLRIPLGDNGIQGGDFFGLYDMTLAQLESLSLPQLETLPLFDGDICTLQFYTDKAKTNLVFTDDSGSDPNAFVVIQNKLFYIPPDSLINSATGLSTTLNQPEYFVTATWTDGTVLNTSYKNNQNLLFQSVIVASKPNPPFAQDANQAIIVPCGEKTERMKVSGDINFLLCTFDVYVQLFIPNYAGLSEAERIIAQQQAVNTIRNTLLIDRYRNSQCTFYSKDIRGTWVGDMKPIKSDAMLKCSVQVKTASMVSSDGF